MSGVDRAKNLADLIKAARSALTQVPRYSKYKLVDVTPASFTEFKAVRVNSVDRMNEWGRGLSKHEAMIGALMERVERVTGRDAAERLEVLHVVPRESASKVVTLTQLGPTNSQLAMGIGSWELDRPNDYVWAKALDGGASVLVPASRAVLRFDSTIEDSSCSTGLAAHFDREESEVRAMMEVLERHFHHIVKFNRLPLARVRPISSSERLEALSEDLRRNGISIDVLQFEHAQPFPGVVVRLSSDREPIDRYSFHAEFHVAVHWRLDTAIERAVTECMVTLLNSRGSKKRVKRSAYDKDFAAHFERCLDTGNLSESAENFSGDRKSAIREITAHLGAETYIIDLTDPELGIPVTRALMTNVQPNFDLMGRSPTDARARITAHLNLAMISEGVEHDATIIRLRHSQRDDIGLASALASRKSERNFAKLLSVEMLGDILCRAVGNSSVIQGASGPIEHRAYPSGGALFPIDLIIEVRSVTGLQGGYYYFDMGTHTLQLIEARGGSRRLNMPFHAAPCVVWMIYSPSANRPKYGRKALRLATLEAGHLGQNILLLAAVNSTAACSFGVDTDSDVTAFFEEGSMALYAIGLG